MDQKSEFKKLRHEVFKFAVNGLPHAEKIEAKYNLAIKLGAKPPRNKYINYKQLVEERKLKKLQKKETHQFNEKCKLIKKKNKKKKKKLVKK